MLTAVDKQVGPVASQACDGYNSEFGVTMVENVVYLPGRVLLTDPLAPELQWAAKSIAHAPSILNTRKLTPQLNSAISLRRN